MAMGGGAGVGGEGGDATNTTGTNTLINAHGGSAWGKGDSISQSGTYDPLSQDMVPNLSLIHI